MPREADRRTDGQFRGCVAPTRYDFVLTLIPVALVLTLLGARLFGLPTHAALVGWAAVGVVAVVDALFVHPPTRGGRTN